MSDANTDLERDKQIIEKIEKIRNLEDEFGENNSVDLAKDILGGLNELNTMKRGYNVSVDCQVVQEGILKYIQYISDNES